MKSAVIFPHQLFQDLSFFKDVEKIYLIEDSLFFYDHKYKIKFHKQKILLHRASMQFYFKHLTTHKLNCEYVEYSQQNLRTLFGKIATPNSTLKIYDPVDYILEKRIKKNCLEKNINLEIIESPNFLTTTSQVKAFFKDKKKYHQTDFYRYQRTRLNILMDENQKPIGGKLTYDTENRKKFPAKFEFPDELSSNENQFVKEAKKYVLKNFSDHPGTLDDFFFPVTFDEAEHQLQDFIANKFENFGLYEDAMTQNQERPVLFHSALSAPLNIGLLSPWQILEAVTKPELVKKIPLNSLEGFIRQLIGWREFMRAIYILEGSKQRNSNFLKHHRKIPSEFWTAQTGITPIDNSIQKLLKFAYSHHIERLMVLSNFMNLSEFAPNEIYEWFMTFYIDAYDWVMVPNVYGMSLFADGGLITTKPYVSSSNYVLKMSDYKKADWCNLWDALYWHFVDKHQDFLKKNIRFGVIIKQLEKMDPVRKEHLSKLANDYLVQT
jgi:deoxyribodipyrimidine photolyase-related protein